MLFFLIFLVLGDFLDIFILGTEETLSVLTVRVEYLEMIAGSGGAPFDLVRGMTLNSNVANSTSLKTSIVYTIALIVLELNIVVML